MYLTQGRLSVVEFTLKFCTLAAESEWNVPALKADFRHGLNHEILLELTCHDDEATLDSKCALELTMFSAIDS